MKRFSLFILMVLLALFMAACGDENAGTSNQNSDTQSTEEAGSKATENNTGSPEVSATDQEDMKAKMAELEFSEIKVDVSYGKDLEYEAEIEQDKNQPIEAEVEDELNGVYKKGKEAFDDIYPKAQKLNVTSNSTNQEVIDQVLKAFELKTDYQSFEAKFTFNDGTVREIEL